MEISYDTDFPRKYVTVTSDNRCMCFDVLLWFLDSHRGVQYVTKMLNPCRPLVEKLATTRWRGLFSVAITHHLLRWVDFWVHFFSSNCQVTSYKIYHRPASTNIRQRVNTAKQPRRRNKGTSDVCYMLPWNAHIHRQLTGQDVTRLVIQHMTET